MFEFVTDGFGTSVNVYTNLVDIWYGATQCDILFNV